jgi:hypothetical protein
MDLGLKRRWFGADAPLADLARLDAPGDYLRERILAQQAEATNVPLRSLLPIVSVLLLIIPPLFWRMAFRPFVIFGVALIVLTCLYALRKLPRHVKPERI